MSSPVTPRILTIAAAAVGAVLLLAHGAALSRDAALTGEQSLPLWLLDAVGGLGEVTGIDSAVRSWSAARDRWYEAEAETDAVAAVPMAVTPDEELLAEPTVEPGSGSGAMEPAEAQTDAPRRARTGRRDAVDAEAPAPIPQAAEGLVERSPLLITGGGGTTPVRNEAARPSIHRVLIIGASSIEGALGIELERRLKRIPGMTVRRWGRHSTGLARLDYFDWLEKTRSLTAAFEPDLVIAQLGGNDAQAITRPSGGVVAAVHSAQWERKYQARMGEFVEILRSSGAGLVYLGMPIPRDEKLRRALATGNRASKAAVEAAGEHYYSTWALTSDGKGEYLTSVQFGERTRGLRASDGFHLSTAGSGYVAGRILTYLRAAYILPDEAVPEAVAPAEGSSEAAEAPDHAEPIPVPEGSGAP